MATVLDVHELTTMLDLPEGPVPVVDHVSFSVAVGETVALVGESGCGKSMTALSLMRIHPTPPARIAGGRVMLDGRDLLSLSESDMRAVRGGQMAMIFQEPMTSLNPVLAIGAQVIEAIREHRPVNRSTAWDMACDLLRRVNIPLPEQRMEEYPHRLSGGMRQRIMIAMALASQPRVLIADEPTTALDVTIQAQILNLLRQLQAEFGMALVLITHDLGIVLEQARRVVVMYAGRVVEEGMTAELFRRPLHPYTQGLLAATPPLRSVMTERPGRLTEIAGTVPRLSELPPGCAFAARCPKAMALCRQERPAMEIIGRDRRVACFAAATGVSA
ncbi:MAG: ABC transporter ATP-binding protein [Alphaproteobacteria bacterium]|nr:ABC transporter ATP-binding protein [Alphaproteobacteria bacterium]